MELKELFLTNVAKYIRPQTDEEGFDTTGLI